MSSTRREELLAVYEERGPLPGERLIEYSFFITEPVRAEPASIDGFQNDDAYRQSRHYALGQGSSRSAQSAMLRESSLARQLLDKPEGSATIRLIRRVLPSDVASGDPTQGGHQLPWVNVIPPSTKFFLESVTENHEEKVQVADTFGRPLALFFGDRPEVYSYSGTLLNAKNHDWKNEFLESYHWFLRGSQAVKYGATVFLQYDDVVVEGFMLNCQTQQHASLDKGVPFSFNLLVLNRSPLDPRALMANRFARSGASTAERDLFAQMQGALDLLSGTPEERAKKRDELDTFFLVREFTSGNYLPPAGVAASYDATGQFVGPDALGPGTLGGTRTEPTESASFQATALARLDPSDVSRIVGRDVTADSPTTSGTGPVRVG